MVSKADLDSYIATTFGTADSKLISQYDKATVNPDDGTKIAPDGMLNANEMAKLGGAEGLAEFVVTELGNAEEQLGMIIDTEVVTEAITSVFAGDAADTDENGLLDGDEIAAALQSALQVEHFSMVDSAAFDTEVTDGEISLEDVEGAAGADETDQVFSDADEVAAYFVKLGISDDNALTAANMLFDSALVIGDEITASDLLSFMNGTMGEEPSDPPAVATFDTFNTAITDLLSGATALDTGDNEISAHDAKNLSGAGNGKMNVDHISTFLEKMGMTSAQATPAAEYILQHGHRSEDAGADSMWAAHVIQFMDKTGGGDGNGTINKDEFDAFGTYVEEQINGDTPYVDENKFTEAGGEIPANTTVADASEALTLLKQYGVGHLDATNIAEKMTEADVFASGALDLNAIIMGASDTAIDITSLNTFVADALSGNSDMFTAFSYTDNFSLGMFNTAAGSDDLTAEADTVTVDATVFADNVTNGLSSPYNATEVTAILETLGVDPAIASGVADYLIEQIGVSSAIPDDVLFSKLANMNDFNDDSTEDTTIR